MLLCSNGALGFFSGCRVGPGVQFHGRSREFTGQHVGENIERAVDLVDDQAHLFEPRRMQHVVGHLLLGLDVARVIALLRPRVSA